MGPYERLHGWGRLARPWVAVPTSPSKVFISRSLGMGDSRHKQDAYLRVYILISNRLDDGMKATSMGLVEHEPLKTANQFGICPFLDDKPRVLNLQTPRLGSPTVGLKACRAGARPPYSCVAVGEVSRLGWPATHTCHLHNER